MKLAAAFLNQPVYDTMIGYHDIDRIFNWYSVISKYSNIERKFDFFKTTKDTYARSTLFFSSAERIILNQEQLNIMNHLDMRQRYL